MKWFLFFLDAAILVTLSVFLLLAGLFFFGLLMLVGRSILDDLRGAYWRAWYNGWRRKCPV